MTGHQLNRWGLGAALVILAACGTLGPFDGPREELEQARELWEQFEPADYSYSIRRLCFCAPDAIGPVRIVVAGGVVVDARYVAGNDTVPTAYLTGFPPVEGLLDILEEAYDNDASSVDVTYDPDTGVPTQFFIDYNQMTADEELGYEVTAPVEDLTGG